MQTDKSLDQLVEELFGPSICHSFGDVNIQEEASRQSPDGGNTTDLTQKSSSPKVDQASSKADPKAELIGFSFRVQEIDVKIGGKGLSSLLFVLMLLVSVAGAEAATSLLKRLLGH